LNCASSDVPSATATATASTAAANKDDQDGDGKWDAEKPQKSNLPNFTSLAGALVNGDFHNRFGF
jgi:hypothetical protein